MATNSKDLNHPKGSAGEKLRSKVEEALNQIRPVIEMDGGFVELDRIENNTAYVRMKGACGCCPSSAVTLKFGIERIILQQVPEITKVEAVL